MVWNPILHESNPEVHYYPVADFQKVKKFCCPLTTD